MAGRSWSVYTSPGQTVHLSDPCPPNYDEDDINMLVNHQLHPKLYWMLSEGSDICRTADQPAQTFKHNSNRKWCRPGSETAEIMLPGCKYYY